MKLVLAGNYREYFSFLDQVREEDRRTYKYGSSPDVIATVPDIEEIKEVGSFHARQDANILREKAISQLKKVEEKEKKEE